MHDSLFRDMKLTVYHLLVSFLAVLNISCSTITVNCKANSKIVSDEFETIMQNSLDHSTEIWQCYKDHLKVNKPGYEACIDRMEMYEAFQAGFRNKKENLEYKK